MNTGYRDKDWLYEQYITNGRTIKSISEECGVSHTAVERYIKKYSIFKTKREAHLPSKDELIDMYYNKGYGIRKISDLYQGVGTGTINKLLEEYGIKRLSPSELHTIWWSSEENKSMMSEKRINLWKDKEYYEKTSRHLSDREAIINRCIKASATYQGIDVSEWNGFLTPEQTRIRNSSRYSEWRNKVFERDNYTCQCCWNRSCKGNPVELNAHHIENFAHNEDLRFDVNNGITLCRNCHDIRVTGSFHNIYGVHNNNRSQLEEYLIQNCNQRQRC